MRKTFMDYLLKKFILVIRLLSSFTLLMLGCSGGGGGGSSPAAGVEESAPKEVVALSTLDTYQTPGTSYSILKDGNIVYVADGSDGLLVLEISDRSTLKKIGSLPISQGEAYSLAKKGHYLYVGTSSLGVLVVDVSIPESPSLVSSFYTTGALYYITLEGDTLYLSSVSGFLNEFLILDISTPDAPVLTGQVQGFDVYLQSVVSNQVAYVASSDQGLSMIFISEPSYAKIIQKINMGYKINAVEKYGDYLLTAGEVGGLSISDIKNVYPTPVSSLPLTDENSQSSDQPSYQINVQGHYAYIANGNNGVQVVDIQDPAAPSFAARLDTQGFCTDLWVDGDRMVTADDTHGIHLINIAIEPDSDGDGVADSKDAFPNDPSETLDTDQDGIGNNADADDDNDGVSDADDAFPLDPSEWLDTDNDGVGDHTDLFPNDASEWADADKDGIGDNADLDDDNDGVLDADDAFPLDPSESVDTDQDGIGNHADTDDDNDGVSDADDAFPLDSSESVDTDGDGIGNNADLDDDGDGRTDDSDIYPLDTDNDGIDNDVDDDDDNDSVSDIVDAFPLDEEEWEDLNSDGLGDNFPSNRFAVIETNYGTIKLELFEDLVPLTTKNFISLAKQEFYDVLTFHRVIKDFMIQGGDPNGDGTGGPGYKIVDEFPKDDSGNLLLKHDGPGILSMANSGPNTGGSQFFITLAETSWLDGVHTVFGRVVEGMDVVQAIGLVPTDKNNDKPLSDVIINKVSITPF
ncbi:MAG: hypothetical protein CO150_04270 [Nitrospirae bacterium CG_4_9_14_3_um_filter_53_35]|nr:MAG: hypothetical protein CO150_04270 [Nitrospirae bacterium CG_4_9_14_3_um_filter_53_35]